MRKEEKIIETIKAKDISGETWRIERTKDTLLLYFNNDDDSIMEFATNKFDVFCDLRDIIINSSTYELKLIMKYDMKVKDSEYINLEEPDIGLIFYN